MDFGEVNLADAGNGAVQIMTIHKSKGLEFPIVFAAGMGKQFNFQDINSRFLIHPDMGFGVDVILPEKRLILSTVHKQIIRRQLKKGKPGERIESSLCGADQGKGKTDHYRDNCKACGCAAGSFLADGTQRDIASNWNKGRSKKLLVIYPSGSGSP